MGGGTSLLSQTQQAQQQPINVGLDQSKAQYYQLMNQLTQQQINQGSQTQVGVPLGQFSSMGGAGYGGGGYGYSPQNIDPWSFSGSGYG
jgi:hypothetical protein